MKTLTYLFIVVALIICGCSNKPVAFTKDEKPIYSSLAMGVGQLYRIQFEGHVYLIRNAGNQGGICHDPDCVCKNKE